MTDQPTEQDKQAAVPIVIRELAMIAMNGYEVTRHEALKRIADSSLVELKKLVSYEDLLKQQPAKQENLTPIQAAQKQVQQSAQQQNAQWQETLKQAAEQRQKTNSLMTSVMEAAIKKLKGEECPA